MRDDQAGDGNRLHGREHDAAAARLLPAPGLGGLLRLHHAGDLLVLLQCAPGRDEGHRDRPGGRDPDADPDPDGTPRRRPRRRSRPRRHPRDADTDADGHGHATPTPTVTQAPSIRRPRRTRRSRNAVVPARPTPAPTAIAGPPAPRRSRRSPPRRLQALEAHVHDQPARSRPAARSRSSSPTRAARPSARRRSPLADQGRQVQRHGQALRDRCQEGVEADRDRLSTGSHGREEDGDRQESAAVRSRRCRRSCAASSTSLWRHSAAR